MALSNDIREAVDIFHSGSQFLYDVATGDENSTVTNPADQSEQDTLAKAMKAFEVPLDYASGSNMIYIHKLGLDATGGTSVSDEIHEAINAAGDQPKVVIFPTDSEFLCKNIYIPSNTILILNNCKFKYGGSNPNNFVFSIENTQSGIFHMYGAEGAPSENITIVGGELEGSRQSNDWSTYDETDAIQAVWINNLTLDGVVIHDWMQDGIELKGCTATTVRNCRIYDCVDSAIESRAGELLTVHNNHCFRVRHGFSTKPFVKQAGTGTLDGSKYIVRDNWFECFGVSILNNWANFSTFENNIIKPLTVAGEDGLSTPHILHEPHPVITHPTDRMEGIITRGNALYGDITNTFMRQKGNAGSLYSNNECSSNRVVDSCDRGFGLTGVHRITGNYVSSVTATVDAFSLFVVPADYALIDGNQFPSRQCYVAGAATLEARVKISNNNFDSFRAKGSVRVQYINNSNTSTVTLESTLLSVNMVGCEIVSPFVGIDLEASSAKIVGCTILTLGSFFAVRLNADGCTMFGNEVISTTGTSSVIEIFANKVRCNISNNYIDSGSATGSGVRVYGDYNKINHNTIIGGNQNIRIYGSNNDAIGNTCQDSNFENLGLTGTGSNNMIDHNTKAGTGSGLSDAGVGTINGGTNRGF